tara:strand:- start:23 stop:589 length:567 start_codon:yes stop_codon:yes gene_type:complete
MNDKFGINSIINNLSKKFSDNLPEPVYKYDSFIFVSKIFGVIILFTALITSLLSLFSYYNNKDKTNVTIKHFEDQKLVKSISKIVDKKFKKNNTCMKVFDKNNNNTNSYKMMCLRKVDNWYYYLIFCALIILILSFIFLPIVNFHYNKQQYFANPYHRTFIEYVIRLFYPLTYGTSFKEQVMNKNSFY